MILWRMVKCVDAGFAGLVNDRCPIEIRRNTKRTASSALAICAVTDAVHYRQRVDRYRGLTTGASGYFLHLRKRHWQRIGGFCKRQILNLGSDLLHSQKGG